MTEPYKFLRVSVMVFRALAWVALVIQVILGVILLIMGGEPVLVGGVDVPARVVGVLNCLAGVIYLFGLSLIATLIQLLLDIRAHLPTGPSAH